MDAPSVDPLAHPGLLNSPAADRREPYWWQVHQAWADLSLTGPR